MKHVEEIVGVLFDPIGRKSFGATIHCENGRIVGVVENKNVVAPIILPGFVDSHVHIESSMLTPCEFSKAAVMQGTVAAVADPHEVANVAGVEGVQFMIDNAKKSIIKLFFGAPSCVPASPFDECFEPFTPRVLEELMAKKEILFLAEMMNFPGVIYDSENVVNIINTAHRVSKPIDGHAPGLSGEGLAKYAAAGISTDHECFTLEEAIEKISLGMKILIREGSAAKNFNALHPLIASNSESVMFCTDDCHPDELINGHINRQVKKALMLGYDIFDILQATSVNPVKHYNLNVGLLQEGDPADFLVIDNLNDFNILSTYINGIDALTQKDEKCVNQLEIKYVFPQSFNIENLRLRRETDHVKCIEVINDELITNSVLAELDKNEEYVHSDLSKDLLKIAVVSRYKKDEVGVGLIKGFGLKKGALAASIAHDSHHIVVVGCDDVSMQKCIEYIVDNRGGICYFDGETIYGLPLPVYGLMTNTNVEEAAKSYKLINAKVKSNGCAMNAPFMTMSFMSLSVIPHLKLTPGGLFDVDKFSFTSTFI